MRICRGASDEEVIKRMANYKRRLSKNVVDSQLHWQAAPYDMSYFGTCYVMYEAYRRIAEERGLLL